MGAEDSVAIFAHVVTGAARVAAWVFCICWADSRHFHVILSGATSLTEMTFCFLCSCAWQDITDGTMHRTTDITGSRWTWSPNAWYPRATNKSDKKNELEQKIMLEMDQTRTQVGSVDTTMCADVAAPRGTGGKDKGCEESETTNSCQLLARTRRPSAHSVDNTGRRSAQLKKCERRRSDQAIRRNAKLRQRFITAREQR